MWRPGRWIEKFQHVTRTEPLRPVDRRWQMSDSITSSERTGVTQRLKRNTTNNQRQQSKGGQSCGGMEARPDVQQSTTNAGSSRIRSRCAEAGGAKQVTQ